MEGGLSRAGTNPKPPAIIGTEKPPIYAYSRENGDITIIGGYVYRGSTYAAQLSGKYIFGDNGSRRIWALTTNSSGPPTVNYLCSLPGGSGYSGLASFAVDQSNELYMVQIGLNG